MEKLILDEMIESPETFSVQRLADVPETQINLVCLAPRQELPAHNANSNVRLLPLAGEITLALDGRTETLRRHEMAAVDYGTFMQISNRSGENAAFVVIKTPNPSHYGK